MLVPLALTDAVALPEASTVTVMVYHTLAWGAVSVNLLTWFQYVPGPLGLCNQKPIHFCMYP